MARIKNVGRLNLGSIPYQGIEVPEGWEDDGVVRNLNFTLTLDEPIRGCNEMASYCASGSPLFLSFYNRTPKKICADELMLPAPLREAIARLVTLYNAQEVRYIISDMSRCEPRPKGTREVLISLYKAEIYEVEDEDGLLHGIANRLERWYREALKQKN